MEKGGWGLTLKEKSAFGNSSLTPSWLNPIKSSGGGGGVSMFPVNLNGREAAALNEVDFFSDKKPPPAAVVVKKEMGLNNEHNTNTRPDLNVNTGLELVIANGGRDNQSTIDDAVEERRRANKNEVAVLQVELERMNDENQRLKGMLSEATNSYGALQMHLLALVQQQQQHHQISTTYQVVDGKSEEKRNVAATQFLDLAGRCGGAAAAGGDEALSHNNNCRTLSSGERTDSESSPSNNIESAETSSCRPNKLPKLNPVDNEQAAASADVAATMRKARVSVRARSEATMISDGCQWRKYGQKMAKGNPWPRAYYRCTMAIGCPVRKQVQRCVDDRTILNTTYEGAHNHPLPPAAMAMAATTSSAANTLLSGAMSSADVMMMNPNFLGRSIFPCSSSIATISASAPFPTITLDLTQQAPNSLPNYAKPPTNTYFPFSHAPQNLHNYVSAPQVFGQAGLYNQSKFSGLQVSNNNIPQHPSFGHETLSAAATAAITADPNFTAALAAAISSMINGSQPNTSSGTTTNSNNSSFPAK